MPGGSRSGIRWAEEERILVLDFYLRRGCLRAGDPRVAELCRVLNRLFHTGRPGRGRGEATVVMKLQNYAWLDPDAAGGLSNFASGDERVWDRYAPDEAALDAAVAKIMQGRTPPWRRPG